MEKVIQEAARHLRKNLTPAEGVLWKRLRYKRLGHKFRRQHAVGRFIADFACIEQKLIIELDGEHHASQTERDRERDYFLTEHGYKVLRFWNYEVERDIGKVINVINQNLNEPPAPGPSPASKGGEKNLSF
ncbi:MAG: endonuclease domain-containing protein [Nitrospirota bacterium]